MEKINNNQLIKNEETLTNKDLIKNDQRFKSKLFNKFKISDDSFLEKKFHIKKKMIRFNKFVSKFCKKDDLIIAILVIISIILYQISLMKCNADPSECTIKHGMIFYFTIGILAAISSVLYSIFIALSLYRRKYFINYIYSIPIYIYYFITDTGTNTLHHGFYNSFFWVIFCLIISQVLFFILNMINCYKKKKYSTIFFIISIIFVLSVVYYTYPGFSCDYWDLGLNNTRINNNETEYPCKIMHPGKNKCYLKLFNNFFDMSKIFRPSCSAEKVRKKEKDILISSLSNDYIGISKLNHFGYPITTVPDKYSMYNTQVLQEYQDLVTHNIIKMDVYNEKNYPNEPYPEVELFFDEKGLGNIKINVTRNETLSTERKK